MQNQLFISITHNLAILSRNVRRVNRNFWMQIEVHLRCPGVPRAGRGQACHPVLVARQVFTIAGLWFWAIGQAFCYRLEQIVRPEWFVEAVHGPEGGCHAQKVRRVIRRVPGQNTRHGNDRDRRSGSIERLDGLKAVHARHEQVNDHNIEPGLGHRGNAGATVPDDFHLETLPFKHETDGGPNALIVINDEDARHYCSPAQVCRAPQEGGLNFDGRPLRLAMKVIPAKIVPICNKENTNSCAPAN
jgi:hypothetical protein